MTTLNPGSVTCAVCGTLNHCTTIGSTNQMEAPDLDLRPGEMARSTMSMWVTECSKCGYCAGDIGEASPEAATLVASEEYMKQLKDPNFPDLANRFLCSSMIMKTAGDPADAGWECLRAAWVCDDAQLGSAAQSCRLKAIALFEQVRGAGERIDRMPGTDEAFLADLYRRTLQFDTTKVLVKEGLRKAKSGPIHSVLLYQGILAGNGDTGCHTVEDAMGDR